MELPNILTIKTFKQQIQQTTYEENLFFKFLITLITIYYSIVDIFKSNNSMHMYYQCHLLTLVSLKQKD